MTPVRTTTSQPTIPRRSFPPIRVIPGQGGRAPVVQFAGPAATSPPPFERFGLPAVPRSLVGWLATLHARFHAEHGRCLASLLLLDPRTRSWSAGLPPQRCARDAASWDTTSPDDFPGLPAGTLVAGTFQSRVLSADESPADAVPPAAPGVHLVQVMHVDGPQRIWIFLSTEDGVSRLTDEQAIDDDWASTLLRSRDRLQQL